MFTGRATEWHVAYELFLACVNIGVHAAEHVCSREGGWREGNTASEAFSLNGEITGGSTLFLLVSFSFSCNTHIYFLRN